MSGRSKAKQHRLAARIFEVLGLIGVVVIPIMAVACGNSTNAEVREGAADSITEVKIASDSVWRVPAGLSIVLPMTNERLYRMLGTDPGGPPDIPEFTIQGAIVEGQDEEQIFIAISTLPARIRLTLVMSIFIRCNGHPKDDRVLTTPPSDVVTTQFDRVRAGPVEAPVAP